MREVVGTARRAGRGRPRRPSPSTRRRSAAGVRARARPRSRAVAAHRPTASPSPGRRTRRSPTRSRYDVDVDAFGMRHAPHDVVADAHTEHLRLGSLRDDRGSARVARDRPRPGGSSSPPVGARRPARSRASVDLPEPFAPTIATSSAGRDVERDVDERVARRVRIAVANAAQRRPAPGPAPPRRRSSPAAGPSSSTTASPNAPRTRISAGVDRPCASQMPNHRSRNSVIGMLIHQ